MFSLWLNKIFLCTVMISCLAIIKSLDKNIGVHTASTVVPVVCHQKTFSMKTFRSPSATFHSNQAAISAFRVTEGPSLCAGPTRPSTPPQSSRRCRTKCSAAFSRSCPCFSHATEQRVAPRRGASKWQRGGKAKYAVTGKKKIPNQSLSNYMEYWQLFTLF